MPKQSQAAVSPSIAQLQRKAEQLAIINQFASSLIHLTQLDELFDYVSKEVVLKLGFVDCVIFLADHQHQALNQVAKMGMTYQDLQHQADTTRISFNQGITGYVVQSGQAEIIADLSKDHRYLADTNPALSEICVPLIYAGQVLGVIDCEHPEKDYFNAEHLDILTTVASLLSARINQCNTLADLKNTVDQLNQAQLLEQGLLQMANLTYDSEDMKTFYGGLHQIVASILPAENLFIAYYNTLEESLEIPYIIEHGTPCTKYKRFAKPVVAQTASVFAIKSNCSMLLNKQDYIRHIEKGHFNLLGGLPESWLGVPFELNANLKGIIVIQSYCEDFAYSAHDQDILTYISRQLSLAINRALAKQDLQYKVLHDELTGLANRALLIDRLTHAITRLSRQSNGQVHALLYLDFDRFKIINDTLGHQVGDKFLIEICRLINGCIREVDTFSRLGGDEFAILVENVAGKDTVNQLIERIQEALADPLLIDEHVLQASTSIGVSFANKGSDEAYKILQRADAAMYEAKSLGRGQVQFFNESMREKLKGAALIERDIQHGIAHNEFELYYQPIFTIDNQTIIGFEALVRWHHPERGFVAPNDFISIAEETGQILSLDNHILNLAAKQLQQWQALLPADFKVTVNVSSRHFSSLDFVDFIHQLYQKYTLRPGILCIEITESGLIENLELATQIIKGLESLKVKLCLDDFGTGYSALGYLHQLPIHILKIDKSFIDNLADGEHHPLVDAILTLAKSLALEVVAEGIETDTQLQLLQQTSCRYGQGYLIAKPLNVEEAFLLINRC